MFDQQTLLLADDCEDDIVIMRTALERASVPNPLQVVYDGVEALEYLSAQGKFADRRTYPLPVVLFLDLNMPKMGGLEVLAWVRQQPGLKLMTVQILSASSREADIYKAGELGANGYLIKPSKYSDLVDMLKSWHSLSRFQAMVMGHDEAVIT